MSVILINIPRADPDEAYGKGKKLLTYNFPLIPTQFEMWENTAVSICPSWEMDKKHGC